MPKPSVPNARDRMIVTTNDNPPNAILRPSNPPASQRCRLRSSGDRFIWGETSGWILSSCCCDGAVMRFLGYIPGRDRGVIKSNGQVCTSQQMSQKIAGPFLQNANMASKPG